MNAKNLTIILIVFFISTTAYSSGHCASLHREDVFSQEPKLTVESPRRFNVDYFADDEMMMVGSENSLHVYNTSDFEVEYTLDFATFLPDFTEATTVSLSTMDTDTGSLLFVGSNHFVTSTTFTGQLTRWDAITGKLLSVIDTDASITNLSTNPISELMVYTRNFNEIRIVDVHSGDILESFETVGRFGGLPVFSVEGNLMAYLSNDITVWDITRSEELFSFTPSRPDVSEIFFSPDGSKIFVIYDGDIIFDLWNVNTGERLDTVFQDNSWLSAYDFHPFNHFIAYSVSGEARIQFFPLTAEDVSMFLEVDDSAIVDIDFDTTGNVVATSDWDGVVTIWNVSTGSNLSSFSFGEQVLSH